MPALPPAAPPLAPARRSMPAHRRASARVSARALPRAVPRALARGFTLVEMLVVILIIAVLLGLVTAGVIKLVSGTADRSTTTRLEMLDSMMAAYASANASTDAGQGNVGATRLPGALKVSADASEFYSTSDSAADPAAAPAATREPLIAPDISAAPPLVASDPARFPPTGDPATAAAEPAVARTQAVLRRLLTIPDNQRAFATLPDSAKTGVLATAGSILGHSDPTAAQSPLDPPLLLDAHGNLILYVPPTGLKGLDLSAAAYGGFRGPANESDPANWDVLVAVDGRAFWVSAGADGSFQAADDNVYSTQVMKKPAAPAVVP